MRAISGAERALIAGDFNVHVMAETVNALGAWVDVTTLLGGDWFLDATFGTDLDNPVGTATVTVLREANVPGLGLVSLSPLVGSSPANDGGPLFDYERPFRLRTACVAVGTPKPAEASPLWQYVFLGKITGIEAGGEDNAIRLDCLDEGAREADAWIKDETEYGLDEGQPIESVMQDIRAAWAPWLPNIVVDDPPGYMVRRFKQEQSSVLAAVRDKLALGMIGFDYRWRWVDRTTFAPVLRQPERDTPTVQATFPATEYLAIPRLGGTGDDMRNVIRVKFPDAEGNPQTVEERDAASIARFGGAGKGERWGELVFGTESNVRDEDTATRIANSAVSDLAFPDVGADIETTYFWPAEIGDFYQFGANGDQFTTAQQLAVVAVKHTITRTSMRTLLSVRGKPAAAYRRWLDLPESLGAADDGAVDPLRLKNFEVFKRTPEGVYVRWEDGDLPSRAAEVDYYLITVADDVSAESAWPDEETVPTGQLDPIGQEFGPIPYPALGSVTYASFVPLALETLAPGDAEKVTVNSVGVPPHFGTFTFTVNPATGLVGNAALEVIDPQTFGGVLKAWVNHDSPDDADKTRQPDGTITLEDTPYVVDFADAFTTPLGTAFFVMRDIRVQPNKNKAIFFEFVNTKGVTSGVRRFTIIGSGGVIDETGNLVDKAILSGRQFADAIRPTHVFVDALPSNPDALGIKEGDLVTLFDTSVTPPTTTLVRRTAAGWENAIKFVEITGQVVKDQIANNSVGITKFAQDVMPVATVDDFSSPPVDGALLAFDGTDLKRWVNGAWTNAVPAVAIQGELTELQLALGAVSSRVLATLAVTTTHIANDAITTPKIAAGAVVTNALAANAVTAEKVLARSLTADRIASNAITANEIAVGSLTGDRFVARTITAGLIAVATISATEIKTRTITGDRLVFSTITGQEIAALTITAAHIVGATITGDKIAGNTISGDKLIANTIQAGGISASGITAIAIAAKSVKASMMEVAVLSDIKDASGQSVGLGIIVNGRLNAVAAGAYLDLNATGVQPVLHHPQFDLLANGSAIFSADVSSQYFLANNARFAWTLWIGDGTAQVRSGAFGQTAAIKFYDAGNTVWNPGTSMWLRTQSYGNELWSFYDLFFKVFTNRTIRFTSDSNASSGAVSFEVEKIGFFNVSPVTRRAVTGTRAVQSSGQIPAFFELLNALEQLGLIINQTTF